MQGPSNLLIKVLHACPREDKISFLFEVHSRFYSQCLALCLTQLTLKYLLKKATNELRRQQNYHSNLTLKNVKHTHVLIANNTEVVKKDSSASTYNDIFKSEMCFSFFVLTIKIPEHFL